jgi:hypothetical protein
LLLFLSSFGLYPPDIEDSDEWGGIGDR